MARFLGTVFIRQNKDDFTSLPINLCSHEIFQNEQNSKSFLGRRILNCVRIRKPEMSGSDETWGFPVGKLGSTRIPVMVCKGV